MQLPYYFPQPLLSVSLSCFSPATSPRSPAASPSSLPNLLALPPTHSPAAASLHSHASPPPLGRRLPPPSLPPSFLRWRDGPHGGERGAAPASGRSSARKCGTQKRHQRVRRTVASAVRGRVCGAAPASVVRRRAALASAATVHYAVRLFLCFENGITFSSRPSGDGSAYHRRP
jgi:hypothetical protein